MAKARKKTQNTLQDSIYYEDYRWPELKDFAARGAIVILPVGQVEQHGPHLPVGTDLMISRKTAELVAERAKAEMPVLVLPPVWAGFSGKGLFKWPGTVSLPPEVVIATVENIIISLAKSEFRKFLIINSHGHHEGILRVAVRKIADACTATVVLCHGWRMAEEATQAVRDSEEGGSNHAGEYETSLLLAMDERVDMNLAVDEPVRRISKFVGPDLITRHNAKVFWSTWGHSSSKTGTYGCPTKATREKGEAIIDGTVSQFLELMREIHQA